MERLFLIPTTWADPTVKQWLYDHPGHGPLDKQELSEGAWLVINYWKTSRTLEWFAEVVAEKPSLN